MRKTIISFFNRYKQSAVKRNIDFTLKLDDFIYITLRCCYYCGTSPGNRFGRGRNSVRLSGIDRVDNSVGYISGNCVPCCKTCNYAKGQMTIYEFKDWVDRVHRHLV